LDEPIDCKGKSEFVWIGLFEPSERELEQLEKNYGLHPLAIEDALKANQMPKVDIYGDQLFVMTRTAHLEHDHIAYGETAIFVGKNFIISVRHGSARAHSDLRAQLKAAPLDHVRRVDAMVNSLRDVLTSVFEVSNLLEQQRQGVITRQLAAWAAILAVPTAIAGIYGMNFENMPELKTQYGYFVVIGIIALLCAVLYLRFKRARWL
jgi:Mg2+ and Co2+ transporter CorA